MRNPNRAALRPQPQPKNRARQRLINYQINQSQQKRREAAAEAIAKVEAFIQGDWKAFEDKVKATPIDLFQNIKK